MDHPFDSVQGGTKGATDEAKQNIGRLRLVPVRGFAAAFLLLQRTFTAVAQI